MDICVWYVYWLGMILHCIYVYIYVCVVCVCVCGGFFCCLYVKFWEYKKIFLDYTGERVNFSIKTELFCRGRRRSCMFWHFLWMESNICGHWLNIVVCVCMCFCALSLSLCLLIYITPPPSTPQLVQAHTCHAIDSSLRASFSFEKIFWTSRKRERERERERDFEKYYQFLYYIYIWLYTQTQIESVSELRLWLNEDYVLR